MKRRQNGNVGDPSNQVKSIVKVVNNLSKKNRIIFDMIFSDRTGTGLTRNQLNVTVFKALLTSFYRLINRLMVNFTLFVK